MVPVWRWDAWITCLRGRRCTASRVGESRNTREASEISTSETYTEKNRQNKQISNLTTTSRDEWLKLSGISHLTANSCDEWLKQSEVWNRLKVVRKKRYEYQEQKSRIDENTSRMRTGRRQYNSKKIVSIILCFILHNLTGNEYGSSN